MTAVVWCAQTLIMQMKPAEALRFVASASRLQKELNDLVLLGKVCKTRLDKCSTVAKIRRWRWYGGPGDNRVDAALLVGVQRQLVVEVIQRM